MPSFTPAVYYWKVLQLLNTLLTFIEGWATGRMEMVL